VSDRVHRMTVERALKGRFGLLMTRAGVRGLTSPPASGQWHGNAEIDGLSLKS
jgi:hypothetical protein